MLGRISPTSRCSSARRGVSAQPHPPRPRRDVFDRVTAGAPNTRSRPALARLAPRLVPPCPRAPAHAGHAFTPSQRHVGLPCLQTVVVTPSSSLCVLNRSRLNGPTLCQKMALAAVLHPRCERWSGGLGGQGGVSSAHRNGSEGVTSGAIPKRPVRTRCLACCRLNGSPQRQRRSPAAFSCARRAP